MRRTCRFFKHNLNDEHFLYETPRYNSPVNTDSKEYKEEKEYLANTQKFNDTPDNPSA